MTKISIVHHKDRKVIETRPEDNFSSDAEVIEKKVQWFPASDEQLQLFEVHVKPGHVARQHAHSTDEIILVTQGDLTLGAQELRAGSAIYIAANTLYGFRSGPDGAVFLNFRTAARTKYITKEEFRDLRREGDAPLDGLDHEVP
jgi:quercetin dioxygenase-like cupin family protein